MKYLPRLTGLLLLALVAQLPSGCATARHDAQAPGPVRRRYHHAERRNERRRRRPHPALAGPDLRELPRPCYLLPV